MQFVQFVHIFASLRRFGNSSAKTLGGTLQPRQPDFGIKFWPKQVLMSWGAQTAPDPTFRVFYVSSTTLHHNFLPKSEKRQPPKSLTHHSRSNFDVSFQVGLWQNSTCGPYHFEGHLHSLSHWQKQGLSKNPHFPDCLIDSPQGFISSNT